MIFVVFIKMDYRSKKLFVMTILEEVKTEAYLNFTIKFH